MTYIANNWIVLWDKYGQPVAPGQYVSPYTGYAGSAYDGVPLGCYLSNVLETFGWGSFVNGMYPTNLSTPDSSTTGIGHEWHCITLVQDPGLPFEKCTGSLPLIAH